MVLKAIIKKGTEKAVKELVKPGKFTPAARAAATKKGRLNKNEKAILTRLANNMDTDIAGVKKAIKKQYDQIEWEKDESHFKKWCDGMTGYPIVDAGMRELNNTGFMHNRVRMITASFLTKHLLIDWRWGEAYFASKLLDYEMASNVGGWQWASGSGCDAAPYFRIFNPYTQQQKLSESFPRKYFSPFLGPRNENAENLLPEVTFDHFWGQSWKMLKIDFRRVLLTIIDAKRRKCSKSLNLYAF